MAGMKPNLPPLSEIGKDGFDEDGCAACGGTLLLRYEPDTKRAWLRCAGCEREFRLGPVFTFVVRDSLNDQTLEVAPITEPPDSEEEGR